MIKCHEGKRCGVISGHHRRACCDQGGKVSFLWGIKLKWTFELVGSRQTWKDGREDRWSISGRRNSMYWRRTIRAQFSEKAGRAGEWDDALLGRGGVWSCRVLKFMLRVWIFILRAIRSHQKIFKQGVGVVIFEMNTFTRAWATERGKWVKREEK